jgi:hypothetical protein
MLVGDVNQSLYGYTGAGAEILEHLKETMGTTRIFPLTCSWRLPVLHIEKVVQFMHTCGRREFTLAPKPGANKGCPELEFHSVSIR